MTKRSACDLHSRRVGGHARHRQAAIIHAIGGDFILGQNPRFNQRRIERDRIVTYGEIKPIAPFPFWIIGAQAHRMKIGHGQNISDTKRLTDIALPLHLAHQ